MSVILLVFESKDEEVFFNDKKWKVFVKGCGKVVKKKIEFEFEDDEDVDDESDDEFKFKGVDFCFYFIVVFLRVGLYFWMNKNYYCCLFILFEILGWLEFLVILVLCFICVFGYCV